MIYLFEEHVNYFFEDFQEKFWECGGVGSGCGAVPTFVSASTCLSLKCNLFCTVLNVLIGEQDDESRSQQAKNQLQQNVKEHRLKQTDAMKRLIAVS